jgi:transposase
MLARLTGQNLPQWISSTKDAGLPGLSSFAKGLEHDLDAVTAGLTTRWNSGPVEGRVNHIKMMSSSRGRLSPRLSRNRT